jgi:hypothetical protein
VVSAGLFCAAKVIGTLRAARARVAINGFMCGSPLCK